MTFLRAPVLALLAVATVTSSAVASQRPRTLIEPPSLASDVASGKLPGIEQRVPAVPSVVRLDQAAQSHGQYGGRIRMLMGSPKDIRMMVVYGYARLVGFDRDLNIVPDLLERVDAQESRIFTLHLRPGHRWSDGQPFTSEDFRYYWQDIVMNKELSPAGPPTSLVVDGEVARFEVIDERTVRFSWSKPNPFFLPELAGAAPLYIYRPAHYLKQFHTRHADPETLKKKIKEEGQRNWVALQFHMGRQYRNENPELPTLDPWVLRTKPPADRFIFARNPFYHRVDAEGRQLPYIDEVEIVIASAKLIPAKVGAGETDLQARNLQFNNYTFLKQGEKTNNYVVRLWKSARGSQVALYPNLNTTDPEWRALFRNVDFRRALSLGINRREINQVIFFGLAIESNNTVLPSSHLHRPEYTTKWAVHDPHQANAILDRIGLTKRDSRGIRLLPDGRSMELIIETAGEEVEQTDVLELLRDNWFKIGIKVFIKPMQREVFRNRIFAGSTLMSIWYGLENGIPTPDTSPQELAPTSQEQLQWPKWGQHFSTYGKAGEPVDLEPARNLMSLYESWIAAKDRESRADIWHRMLAVHADEVFTIGLVSGVPQPVVVNKRMRNVPEKGVYNWDPGAHFGIYRPDTFWFSTQTETAESGRK
ncbi:MAG: ABC transporter substrate-binding protein [Rhodospirillales bacterium]|nr:ABC transporter substrate-binding protein [Rhodospirillales bacterium]